jgi:predicted enzyme related to lactoylglutathione lyase
MRVKGLVWLGIPADDHAAAVGFFTETLGLDVAFDEAGTTEMSAANDDRIQVFGPGHRYFRFYRDRGASIVPLFEVDDLDEARAGLARSGAEIFGEPESDGVWRWLTFRAPDGNIYSLGARHG